MTERQAQTVPIHHNSRILSGTNAIRCCNLIPVVCWKAGKRSLRSEAFAGFKCRMRIIIAEFPVSHAARGIRLRLFPSTYLYTGEGLAPRSSCGFPSNGILEAMPGFCSTRSAVFLTTPCSSTCHGSLGLTGAIASHSIIAFKIVRCNIFRRQFLAFHPEQSDMPFI